MLNAASEVAVGAFLKGHIGFTDMYTVADKVIQRTEFCAVESFEQLCGIDKISRERAIRLIDEINA